MGYRPPENPQEIAARIRAARAWAGMKQKELAEAIGRSVSTVERIERGDPSAIGNRRKRERMQDEVAKATGVWIGFLQGAWGGEAPVAAGNDQESDLLSQLADEARASLAARGAGLTWEAIAQEVLAIAMRRASEQGQPVPGFPDPSEVERGLDEIEAEQDEPPARKRPASGTQREAG